MRPAVFLDRDGVIFRPVVRDFKPYAPRRIEEARLVPQAEEALASLRQAGFLLIVVTNQPDVARGAVDKAVVEQMNRYLCERLPIDDVFVCYHDDAEACECRKPKPGLLRNAAQQYGINLASSFMVGDRWRDVEAGHCAGCRTVWIDCGYRERPPRAPASASVSSLKEAADWILGQARD